MADMVVVEAEFTKYRTEKRESVDDSQISCKPR